MSRTYNWLGGFLLGSAVMSLADPQSGPRRRALLRNKAIRVFHQTSEFVDRGVRDLRNRACGAMAEARARRRDEPTEDEVLIERVRSKLGRHATHPHAIEVGADRGRVILRGPVPDAEAADLLAVTTAVTGVTSVLDRFERQDPGALASASPGNGTQSTARSSTWTPGLQLLAAAGGVLVLTTGAVLLARARRGSTRALPDYASLLA